MTSSRTFAGLFVAVSFWLFTFTIHVLGQESEKPAAAPLETQVVELIKQLDTTIRTDRDSAEEKLLELGPGVLKFFPEMTSPELTAEQRRRLRRVLPELWKKQLYVDVAGSTLALSKESMALSEVLNELSERSENPVTDMRSEFNQPTPNPALTLDKGDMKFWPLLDRIAESANLGYYHFTDDRSVGLQQRQGPGGPVSYDGAFRFELQRIMLDHRFDQPEQGPTLGVTIGVFIEPRLKPILLELDLARCAATDDLGNVLVFQGTQRLPLSVDKTAYHMPISLRMAAPQRKATTIAKLEGELSVWLPTHTQEFVFKGLGEAKPETQSSPTLRVSLQGITNDEGLWTAPLIMEQLLDVGQVDSYLQAALENEIFLRHKDGTRFDQNGGLSTFSEEPGKLGIEYLFVDAPGSLSDYELVLRVPTGLTAVPVRFSFKDLPLP